ncbi:DUF4326 domain-containing protein [Sediminicurvatus halobius]|uniref:DUF4326 domain-containing protein n=1 Tax=Sediminicurvatus halobius TaxID=2182432 RepID=A0A2U2MY39_9GAMM|nr:DUF4326 domain-containing protein [Spiribacter halobius]PWG61727.1 hypothetical protein DEM34_14770 [Spiribacter halobius]UEX76846.1 DUF4326 domain-containing protein [Spiribacter halobius]
MTPKRIQLRRARGWRMPENTVKVDRSTPWGNPFITGKHGTRAECVELYRGLMAGFICLTTFNADKQKAAREHVIHHIDELRGKNLACWCPPDAPCHADVLLEIANREETP